MGLPEIWHNAMLLYFHFSWLSAERGSRCINPAGNARRRDASGRSEASHSPPSDMAFLKKDFLSGFQPSWDIVLANRALGWPQEMQ